jgi:hypothetical protein
MSRASLKNFGDALLHPRVLCIGFSEAFLPLLLCLCLLLCWHFILLSSISNSSVSEALAERVFTHHV